MFASELEQTACRMSSPIRIVANLPVEDDYTEESFPDDDRDGDQAWRCQEKIGASQMLRDARRWAKRPYREVECPAPNA